MKLTPHISDAEWEALEPSPKEMDELKRLPNRKE